MARVQRLGNSLAALIPAQAARQMGLTARTEIVVYFWEETIYIRNANGRVGGHSKNLGAETDIPVKRDEEPW